MVQIHTDVIFLQSLTKKIVLVRKNAPNNADFEPFCVPDFLYDKQLEDANTVLNYQGMSKY